MFMNYVFIGMIVVMLIACIVVIQLLKGVARQERAEREERLAAGVS